MFKRRDVGVKMKVEEGDFKELLNSDFPQKFMFNSRRNCQRVNLIMCEEVKALHCSE